MRMKHLWIFLLLSACGSDKTTLVEPKIEPVVEKTVESPLLGKWVDTNGNTLEFKSDGSVLSNDQTMSYEVQGDRVSFLIEGLSVDLCGYHVRVENDLLQPFKVILDLICAQTGTLQYVKN